MARGSENSSKVVGKIFLVFGIIFGVLLLAAAGYVLYGRMTQREAITSPGEIPDNLETRTQPEAITSTGEIPGNLETRTQRAALPSGLTQDNINEFQPGYIPLYEETETTGWSNQLPPSYADTVNYSDQQGDKPTSCVALENVLKPLRQFKKQYDAGDVDWETTFHAEHALYTLQEYTLQDKAKAMFNECTWAGGNPELVDLTFDPAVLGRNVEADKIFRELSGVMNELEFFES